MKFHVLLIILVASQALAQQHTHAWIEQARWQSEDNMTVCSWRCISDFQNNHTTQTVGYGGCPYPI